jgi:hypothetical protein
MTGLGSALNFGADVIVNTDAEIGGLLADLVAANRILLADIRSRLLAAELNRSGKIPPARNPGHPGEATAQGAH